MKINISWLVVLNFMILVYFTPQCSCASDLLGGEQSQISDGITLKKAVRSIEEIRTVFNNNSYRIKEVYGRAQGVNPTLGGKIVIELKISPEGKVVGCRVVSSELKSPQFETELVDIISQYTFEKKDVDQMLVTWPFDFRPSLNTEQSLSDQKFNENKRRLMEELSRTIEAQNQNTRTTIVTATTKAPIYQDYYQAVSRKIEKIGTDHFPEKDGKKLYGDGIISIPIFQDGTIYEKDGGPRIEKGSGNSDLDSYTLKIVRQSAPFDPLPGTMRTPGKNDVVIIITRFNYFRQSSTPISDQTYDQPLNAGITQSQIQ